MTVYKGYLSLYAVEASEPEDLPPAELSLGVVYFVQVLQFLQLLVGDLFLLRSVTCRLQELQPARGDGGDDLNRRARGYSTFEQPTILCHH